MFVACAERQPAALLDEQPLFDINNGPPQSGIVIRDGAVTAYTWADPATGQRVTFGAFDEEYCAGTVVFDEIYWADKVLPLDVFRLVSLNPMDDVRTTVWPLTPWSCSLFESHDPVARALR